MEMILTAFLGLLLIFFYLYQKYHGIERKMNECCLWRGNPLELMHRTIHQLAWFVDDLRHNKAEFIIKDLHEFHVNNAEFENQLRTFQYQNHPFTELITIFHQYCRIIYWDNPYIVEMQLDEINRIMEKKEKE